MIHNGLNIIELNDKYNEMKNGCPSCTYNEIPNEASCVYNKHFGLCAPNGCNGLGQNNFASPVEQGEQYNPQLQQPIPYPGRPSCKY